MHVRKLCRWLFFATILAIFVGSLLPQEDVAMVFVLEDWIVHAGAYAFCGCLGVIGYCTKGSRNRALVCLFLIGFAIEVIQPYVGRFFGWSDVAANSCGIAIAYAISFFIPVPGGQSEQ